jgi:hypothetical protein
MELRASHMLGKRSTTKLHPEPTSADWLVKYMPLIHNPTLSEPSTQNYNPNPKKQES